MEGWRGRGVRWEGRGRATEFHALRDLHSGCSLVAAVPQGAMRRMFRLLILLMHATASSTKWAKHPEALSKAPDPG